MDAASCRRTFTAMDDITIPDDRAMLVLEVDRATLDSLAEDLDVEPDGWTAGNLADAADMLAEDD